MRRSNITRRPKKNAPALRGKWVEDLCIAKAEKSGESSATGIKVMYHREKVRKDNRVINKVMEPSQRRLLTMVQTTGTTGEKTVHVTKTAIEAACIAENDRHFCQSHTTPLQHPVAIDVLGRTGMAEVVDEIL